MYKLTLEDEFYKVSIEDKSESSHISVPVNMCRSALIALTFTVPTVDEYVPYAEEDYPF